MSLEVFAYIIIFIEVVYLFAIAPSFESKQRTEKLMGKHYAHRGFHDNNSDAPENSMKAFNKAVQNGYGIELDIQITKDKQVVVFHDYTLNRVCGVDKQVSDCTYEELKELCLLNTTEKIPLFSEVLALVNGQVPLIVEIKKKNGSDPICEYAWEILKDYKGIYCMESFHPFAVLWFKKNHPEVVRGQLAMNFHKHSKEEAKPIYILLRHLLFNFLTKPDFIAYDHRSKKAISKNLCRNMFGCTNVAWTITTQQEMDDSKEYFDLYIFEGFRPNIKPKKQAGR